MSWSEISGDYHKDKKPGSWWIALFLNPSNPLSDAANTAGLGFIVFLIWLD